MMIDCSCALVQKHLKDQAILSQRGRSKKYLARGNESWRQRIVQIHVLSDANEVIKVMPISIAYILSWGSRPVEFGSIFKIDMKTLGQLP